MFKFMNRRPHVYLLRSDKYPNNVKISHSSLMNLCKTFCAPGQYFFRQSFTCERRRWWGGGVGGGLGGAKARIFMPGKHANYAKRVIPSWAGSQNSESAPRPAPPPPRWQCHWITMRGLPLRDAPSSLRPRAGARPSSPLLPPWKTRSQPASVSAFRAGAGGELGGPAAEVTCCRQTARQTDRLQGQDRSSSERGERTPRDPGSPRREQRRCWPLDHCD